MCVEMQKENTRRVSGKKIFGANQPYRIGNSGSLSLRSPSACFTTIARLWRSKSDQWLRSSFSTGGYARFLIKLSQILYL